MATEKEKAYQRAYYLANKTKKLARDKEVRRKWTAKNRDYLADKAREYAHKNAAKIAERKKRKRAETKASEQAYAKQYHQNNMEKRNTSAREWHAKNKDRVHARNSEWQKANPHVCAERARRRDAQKLMATPAWADLEAMRVIYAEAARLTRETGVPHQVDHIYPLQSRLVCGLHCEANLQILTRSQNAAKHNRMPDSQNGG